MKGWAKRVSTPKTSSTGYDENPQSSSNNGCELSNKVTDDEVKGQETEGRVVDIG